MASGVLLPAYSKPRTEGGERIQKLLARHMKKKHEAGEGGDGGEVNQAKTA